MFKVTVIVETDDLRLEVKREDDRDPGSALARCIVRVADEFPSDRRLDRISDAAVREM